uniref:Fatty acid hydroxylase domain-containing protein n=1 Tax=Pyrodinium bahamense TaxID=73915 RepID=A0A7S0FYM6_9DINO|mmetsp:Transcript_6753/g.18619  ORF Transcript_6753/g.18619 Transcript_6753/m.18619 type:complete len:446 (+) Transcript_6753:56-1393(+)
MEAVGSSALQQVLNGALRHAPRDFGTLAFLACLGVATYMMTSFIPGAAQRLSMLQEQTPAESGAKPKFGVAAEENTVFTPEQAAGEESAQQKRDPARYREVKLTTALLDYGFVAGLFGLCNWMVSGPNFSPVAAALTVPMFAFANVCLDLLKAWLFADVVAEVKLNHLQALGQELAGLFSVDGAREVCRFLGRVLCGEGVFRDFRDKNEARHGVLFHIFYFVKVACVMVPLALYLQTKLGLFSFPSLANVVVTYGTGEWWELQLTTMSVVYLEYLLMSFIKDAASMNILHQIMHKQWYPMHKVHHLPMKELSGVNVWFFDVADLLMENVMAPLILLGVKWLSNPSAGVPSLHFLSFLLLAIMDINIHSICPYTVGFYNPVLDMCLRCNVSHQLHHALNTGHYTVWPWHQLKGVSHFDAKENKNVDGSIELDFKAYNTIFNTHFPC